MGIIKIKNARTSKDTIRKVKAHTAWEEIFANYISDGELVSRIYKELWEPVIRRPFKFKMSASSGDVLLKTQTHQ